MFKRKLEEDLKKVVGELGYQVDDIVCDIPKNSAFGDYTSNIPLQLANQHSANSNQSTDLTAKEIAGKIKDRLQGIGDGKDYLEKIEIAGSGFLNFFIKPESLMENLHLVCNYACFVNPDLDLKQENKKIVLEHTSPNTNKPLHVGHARMNILAMALVHLIDATGESVQPVEIINDRGIHIAKSMWGYLMKYIDKGESWEEKLTEWAKKPNSWPSPSTENKRGDYFNGECYVFAEKQLQENEEVAKEHQTMLHAWENKDEKILQLWETMNSWFYAGVELTYQWMGSLPTERWFESEVYEEGKQIVLEGYQKGLFKKGEEGEIYADLSEYKLPDKVLLRPDGTSIYITQDIALTKKRMEKYKADKYIWVVGQAQELHFKQLFKILELLGEDREKFLFIGLGMISLPSGKMSSREGNVLLADELLEMVNQKAKQIATSSATPRNDKIGSEEVEDIINKVSLGAIKFSMLKYSPSSDMTFDLEKSVSLQGDSGPYVQYTYARAKSVLRNAKYDYEVELPHAEAHTKNVGDQLEKEERAVLRLLDYFEVIVSEAAKSFSPNLLTEYLLDLSKAFNLFYQKHPILGSEFRLALTCAVAVTIKQGLNLLGIDSPERM